jgi:hypothetical protein
MRRLLLGFAAGAAGTAVMTALQELVPRLRDGNGDGEEGGEEPAPARAARKVLGAIGVHLPRSWTPFLTQAAHWGYGSSLGVLYALAEPDGSVARDGLAFGAAVWAAAYAELVPLGIYEPPWKYAPAELAEDFSYHALYGLGVAGTYAALS